MAVSPSEVAQASLVVVNHVVEEVPSASYEEDVLASREEVGHKELLELVVAVHVEVNLVVVTRRALEALEASEASEVVEDRQEAEDRQEVEDHRVEEDQHQGP